MIGTTGDDLIREAGGGLVVVTFDYRLGVFGTRSSIPTTMPCLILLLVFDRVPCGRTGSSEGGSERWST